MGKPLKYKEAMANVQTIKKISRQLKKTAVGEQWYNQFWNVSVEKLDVSIIEDTIQVIFTFSENFGGGRADGADFYNIDIFWEDAGYKNFSDIGLYGRYATDYNKINYDLDESTLTIKGDNNIIISIQF
jgi:hypothetical protein